MKLGYLKIGLITSTHGVRGEVNILPLTDDPSRFVSASDVLLVSSESSDQIPGKLQFSRVSGTKVIGKLEGVDTPERAAIYKSYYIAVTRENAVSLPSDTYFVCDIIGCEVRKEDGSIIGLIKDVIETGASDLYSVSREGEKDLLIPAVKEFVLGIDTKSGHITVRLPEGLEEL